MTAKVDQKPAIAPHGNITVTSSSIKTVGSSKISRFGVKSGFFIQKNKLSGSLVTGIRSRVKVESHDEAVEENNKQVQRKTKWDADLTQDASVRRGRALAYQTRLEQIGQQLKSGDSERAEDQGDALSQTEVKDQKSFSHKADDQNLEILDLERRETIGELLKLNPSYKVPPDYKPLLKEAKVPIPLKLYSGYNFVGLIMGSGSSTQKRLQEETGATITIRGIKADSEAKEEVTLSDENEVQSTYKELYVHVSADTFEKIDAAVSLIELLVTPVSSKPAIVSSTPTNFDTLFSSSEVMTPPTTVLNHGGVIQSMARPAQPGLLQSHFQQYQQPWFPRGPSQAPLPQPNSGFIPSGSSSPMPQFLLSPYNPSSGLSFHGGHHSSSPNFGFTHSTPQQLNQVPQMRNHPMSGSQPSLQYPTFPSLPNNSSGPYQVNSNQLRPSGPPTLHMLPPPISNAFQRPFPPNSSSPSSFRPPNQMQTSSQMFLPQRPQVTRPPFLPAPPRAGLGSPMPQGYPQASSGPPNQASPLPPITTQFPQGLQPYPPLLPLRGSAPVPPPLKNLAPTIPQITSPVTTPVPQRPSVGDFTFQPIGPSKLTDQTPPALQPPFFRPTLSNPPPLQFSGNAQLQHNLAVQISSAGPQSRQGGHSVPNQNINHNLSSLSGGNQVYDPFSPT